VILYKVLHQRHTYALSWPGWCFEVRSDNIYPANVDGAARDHDPINNFQKIFLQQVYVEEAWRQISMEYLTQHRTSWSNWIKNGSYAGSATLVTVIDGRSQISRLLYFLTWLSIAVNRHNWSPVSATEANATSCSSVTDVYNFIIMIFTSGGSNLPTNFF